MESALDKENLLCSLSRECEVDSPQVKTYDKHAESLTDDTRQGPKSTILI